MKNENIILASSSPRRIEMMEAPGINPIIIKPDCSETLPANIGMQDAVMFLSLKKALNVEAKLLSESCCRALQNSGKRKCGISDEPPYIIAADTIVYKDGIIGKPHDADDALQILKKLRNSSHFVATGIAIIQTGRPKRKVFCEVTEVFFKNYSDAMLAEYVKTDEPYDKAGGYAVQGTFGNYIERINGDINNVIGFPWDRIAREFAMLKDRK